MLKVKMTKMSIKIKTVVAIFILFYAGNAVAQTKATQNNATGAWNFSTYADSVNNGLIAKDTLKGSPVRTAEAMIGTNYMYINYHSPGVKNRVIWGGLVAYNQVWVTGAHSATSINFHYPVQISNKKIEKGTYAIFTIPGEKEWTLILNKNYSQHLADDYNQAEDVIRVKITPQKNKMTQRLTWSVFATGNSTGKITMAWEKIKVEVPFTTINE
jgi:Protein of unknown function (DUF2911)